VYSLSYFFTLYTPFLNLLSLLLYFLQTAFLNICKTYSEFLSLKNVAWARCVIDKEQKIVSKIGVGYLVWLWTQKRNFFKAYFVLIIYSWKR
jgi:hypothetical protein